MLSESSSNRKNLSETELCMVAEVAIEMARAFAGPFSAHTGAQTLARAALKDSAFMATLAIVHKNIVVRRTMDPLHALAPLKSLFRNLEQAAEKVLNTGTP
jgi:hypothetical protein